MKEVAAGIDHAHRLIDGTTGKPLNLVHRDMSPQNIMVSYEGEVKHGVQEGMGCYEYHLRAKAPLSGPIIRNMWVIGKMTTKMDKV